MKYNDVYELDYASCQWQEQMLCPDSLRLSSLQLQPLQEQW